MSRYLSTEMYLLKYDVFGGTLFYVGIMRWATIFIGFDQV